MVWTEIYPPLAAYFKEHGHIAIHPGEAIQLLIYVRTLQKQYKKNTLSQEQLSLLNEIKFPLKSIRNTWQQNFIELKHFIAEIGLPSLRAKHPSLYVWLISQKTQESRGRLSGDRKEKLQSIGILFNQTTRATAWKKKYTRLREELSQMTPPIKLSKLSPSTLQWFKQQWVAAESSTYDKQKLELLQQLEIKYRRASYKEKWEIRYNEYCQSNTTSSERGLSPSLSRWCLEQRRRHNNGTLLPERSQLLNSAGFNWETD